MSYEDYESIQSETTKIIQEISFILIRRVNICIFKYIIEIWTRQTTFYRYVIHDKY